MQIERLDHIVLTVRDVERTIAFYSDLLGMDPVTFGDGRRALAFGQQKINLHPADAPIVPHAQSPTAGSADLCFLTTTPIVECIAHLQAQGIAIEQGPVPRSGAVGPLISVYVRDPDGNLIEISHAG
jgi:catechol 2,3-dioxygenase-like lactoylglutathione lyase family enzyme